MLTGKEVRSDFVDGTFTVDNTTPTFCGKQNPNQTIPRRVMSARPRRMGWRRSKKSRGLRLGLRRPEVADLIKDETTCPSPTVPGGQPIVLGAPKDISASLTTPVEQAFEIDFETTEATGQFFVIKDTVAVVTFTFSPLRRARTRASCPWPSDVVNKGLKKIVS